MADKLKFVIPGKPEYITMVRLAIGSAADMAGFNIDEIDDIKTAVGEACKSVTCHGSEGFAEAYQVDCQVEEGKIEVAIKDISEGHCIEKTHKPCLDCPNEGDLAFFVITSIMDNVEVIREEGSRNSIKMVKAK